MDEKRVDISRLIDSYLELAGKDPKILDDMLREEGKDPEKVAKRGLDKIRQLFFQAEVTNKKAIISSLYQRAIDLVQTGTEQTKEMILAALRIKSPGLQFRNLEKLDEEHLREILTDTEILDLMNQLDKERGQ
jgi:hypothetical protein